MNIITLAPGHAVNIFLTNMNQHIALHVRQFNVNSVPEAAKIARLHELSLLHTDEAVSECFLLLSKAKFLTNFQESAQHREN